MRKSLVLAVLLVLCCSMASFAGVPDPSRSTCVFKGNIAGCQYRFRCDGGLDCMTLCVTVRDAFDTPVTGASMVAAISEVSGVLGNDLCSPCPLSQAGVTDGSGAIDFIWCKIGGKGTIEVDVTAFEQGVIALCQPTTAFNSPDLNFSCENSPTASTNVVDLGIWAGCLPPSPYCQNSDYNCDLVVNVVDLGVFGGGLGLGCTAGCP